MHGLRLKTDPLAKSMTTEYDDHGCLTKTEDHRLVAEAYWRRYNSLTL
jgi:hypothetical protein